MTGSRARRLSAYISLLFAVALIEIASARFLSLGFSDSRAGLAYVQGPALLVGIYIGQKLNGDSIQQYGWRIGIIPALYALALLLFGVAASHPI